MDREEIFESKENIDVYLLWRISCILQYNFFLDLSNAIKIHSYSELMADNVPK